MSIIRFWLERANGLYSVLKGLSQADIPSPYALRAYRSHREEFPIGPSSMRQNGEPQGNKAFNLVDMYYMDVHSSEWPPCNNTYPCSDTIIMIISLSSAIVPVLLVDATYELASTGLL